MFFPGDLASKLDDPSHTVSMTVRGKSLPSEKSPDKVADELSTNSVPKRKRPTNDEKEKSVKRKVYVVDSESE